MANYVIYRMQCNGTLLCYIGSTTDFRLRKNNHKSDCYNKNSPNYNCLMYKYIRDNNINWNNIEFEIIDTVSCENIKEAWQLEAYYIGKHDSIIKGQNTNLPYGFSKSEYDKQYEKNEKRVEYKRKYRKEKISCPICFKILNKTSMSKHKRNIHNL